MPMYSSRDAMVLQALERTAFDALTLGQLREATGLATLALVHTLEGLERRGKVACAHGDEALWSLPVPVQTIAA